MATDMVEDWCVWETLGLRQIGSVPAGALGRAA